MIKEFYILIIFLSISILFVVINYLTNNLNNRDIISISSITKIHSPSFSTLYFEPRLFSTEVEINRYYPNMEIINRMDFIYEEK
ncbi:hypothetical protein MNB_SV-9-34 [hydrothermal vent metagenome]|uniref:Uncharacterized protein n=1 Tax=hydrothermal vent metagenome TaxID=652676 RepID=A0A1W1BNM0_9ZZZZ